DPGEPRARRAERAGGRAPRRVAGVGRPRHHRRHECDRRAAGRPGGTRRDPRLPRRARDRTDEPSPPLRPAAPAKARAPGRAAAPAGGERARGPRRRRSPPARTRRASRGRRGAQARGCRERRGLPAPRLRQPCSRASAQGRARPAFRPSLDRERDQRGVSRVRARLDRGPQRCGDAAGQPLPRRAGRGARPGGSGRGAPPAPLGWRHDVAAGGGSIAYADEAGALKVGPRSAGAEPGPACYGLGGTEPTVTDANLVLGYLDAGRVYGGSIRLDPDRAATAVEALGRRLGLSPVEMAQGMVEVANANMLRALRLVSVQRGYDLRNFALIAYGGAG